MRKLLIALALLCQATSTAAVTIYAPGSTVEGKTIGAWTADWWSWYLSFPAAAAPLGDEPLSDTTGAFQHLGQTGPIWFVNAAAGLGVGSPPATTATRTFTVPAGVNLLVALLNVNYVRSAGEDPNTLPGIVSPIVDQTTSLLFQLNGTTPLTQQQLFTYREQTGFFTATVVANNAFGEPPGTYTSNWGEGFFVMLSPLAPGEQVTIRGGGVSAAFGGFSIDITNVITAVPEPAAALLAGAALCALGLVRRRSC